MSISVKPLGAGQEVGRSCVIVKIKDVKVMFDCGVHMVYNDNRKFPDFRKIVDTNQSTSISSNIYANLTDDIDYTKQLDLVIITHFHLDHCGALPFFTEVCGYKGPVITSQPTKAILPITLEDFRRIISDYKGEKSIISSKQITDSMNRVQTIELGEERIINNRIRVTSFYAGHVLGAGIYQIEVDGYKVIYTGDYNTASDRHLGGAYVPKLYPNLLITETTYGDTVRDTKRVREREFLAKIQSTLDKGGKVLIPIFALGRAQELCILLDTHWRRTKSEIPIYFAGPLAEKANYYYKIFTNWTNQKIKNIFLERNVFDFTFVKHGDKSVTKINQPMVIFATPGMLHGGLSLQIFKEIAVDAKNCVIIPGYCTSGTIGNKILSGERVIEIDKQIIEVRCDVYYMSFSAHADAKGLLQLVKNASPKNLVLVHGDAEVMKKFQVNVESTLNISTTMPANLNEIFFNVYDMYYQIDISMDLFSKLKYLLDYSFQKSYKLSISSFPSNIVKSGKYMRLTYDNPLKRVLRNGIKTIRNKLVIPMNREDVDFKNLFENFMKENFNKMYCLYNVLISDGLGIEYANKTIVVTWMTSLESDVRHDARNKHCLEVAKYIEHFKDIINSN
jgi:integrator complex subunit 11